MCEYFYNLIQEEEDLPNADADMEDPPVPEINENVNNLTGEETDIMNYVKILNLRDIITLKSMEIVEDVRK